MALIKLTAVSNPDIDDGVPCAIYVDATRVLGIQRASVQFMKQWSVDEKQKLQHDLWSATEKLVDHVGQYIPDMTDPTAVEWMSRARETSQMVNHAYSLWSKAAIHPEHYPRVMCTELQLACGTALEHGVMLARVYVQESPEEVYEILWLQDILEKS